MKKKWLLGWIAFYATRRIGWGTQDGRPVAALIDARLFARIRQMQERFDTLATRLAEAYAGALPEEGMAEIEQAVAEVRAEARAAASRQTEV